MSVLGIACFLYSNNNENIQESAATSYPDHIINGDFEYMGLTMLNQYNSGFVLVSPMGYMYQSNRSNPSSIWTSLPTGFDYSKFGWKSTQNRFTRPANVNDYESVIRNSAVEIQVDVENSKRINTHCELVEQQAETAIYQDIATTPGSVYKWSIKHCSQATTHVDTMSVMIGTPTSQSVQLATRTTSNGTGKIGWTGTIISTISKNVSGQHMNDWETYEGTYIIPQEQTVTRFTFKSIEGLNAGSGNELDDISFSIADPLYYNLNGGTGNLPQLSASGTYPGYYQRGTSVSLSPIVPTRQGYTFLGWSPTKYGDITSAFQADTIQLEKNHTITAGTNTVYAVWAKNPTVTFRDTVSNTTTSITVPFRTSTSAITLPTPANHPGYAFDRYLLPSAESITEDTTIDLIYNQLGTIQVNVKWNDRNNMMDMRPDIELDIPDSLDDAKTYHISINAASTIDASSSASLSFVPIRESPSLSPSIPDIPPYELVLKEATTTTDEEGFVTITYNFIATYIPTTDISITKRWDDMDDVYRERPDHIVAKFYVFNPDAFPADDEEHSPEDFWVLDDTVVLTADDAIDGNSNTWSVVLHDKPLWGRRGHDGDVLYDMQYKIVEESVYGYDLINSGGNIEDGFYLENQIWKHVEMPETGSTGARVITIAGVVMLLIGFTCIGQQKRTHKLLK